MIRKKIIEWQWSDYFSKHRSRLNLLLHILAVPLFWLGCAALITAKGIGVVLLVLSIILQGLGHKLEKEAPTPMNGPLDFISRFLTEQFISFPRFIISGQWLRSYKDN